MRRDLSSLRWVHSPCTQVLVAACNSLSTVWAQGTPSKPFTVPVEPLVRIWEPGITLSTAGGYKDNVALAHNSREGSPFLRASLEASIIRVPVDDYQATLLVTGEETRYFSSPTVDHEHVLIGQFE